MVRRHEGTAFMGGAHVFPGGRVDAADHDGSADWCDGVDEARAAARRLTAISDRSDATDAAEPASDAVAYHVAAARELFEEAGVLLARPMPTQQLERYRRDLLGGQIAFGDIIRVEHLRLAFDELAYFAHWVTPEIETRRFDTRFFIARSPEGQTPVHDEGETSHSEWFAPLAAIERCRSGVISLPPPTWTTLSILSRFASIDEVFAWARRKPIPRVQPRFEKRGERTLLFYPGDPMYPAVEGFDAAAPTTSSPTPPTG